MRGPLATGLGTAVFLAVILLAGVMSNATAAGIAQRPLEAQADFLARHAEIRMPEGADAPVPAALLFHGCGGVRQVQADYAAALNAAGYAAVIVDSNGARGIGRVGAMTQVCGGFRLWGQERAADVFAAVELARADPRIDGDRLTLVGWSHGGWTILDALGFEAQEAAIPALDGAAASLPGVERAIIFYPWCGWPSRTDREGLDTRRPLSIILAGNDLVARKTPCRELSAAAIAEGQPVRIETWDGLTHAFDEPNPPALDPRMRHDAEAAERARARVVAAMRGEGE
ncbi:MULTISPECIES: dienelactone hydrolase family protein [Hyphobacterium]|uniref:Dienelactone hydrolase family protein n=1 Tax=Hyphobacterium vulgare TaxID=1736751 RepID=A0ABV6ZY68_9PROT